MDRYELRRQDYSLSDDQTDLQSAYAKFFKTYSSIDAVRAAESEGIDHQLWERLCATGATSMALPEKFGGDGATLVDLTLVAEEVGRSIAPVPWIDHVTGARLLSRLGALESDPALAEGVVSGGRLVALDPQADIATGPRLVAAGAIADDIVLRDGDDIVRLTCEVHPQRVANLARLPMAWVDPRVDGNRRVLASGPEAVAEYELALDEWRILTAAALAGLVEATMQIAVEFAKSRYTMGVPIGSLQGISHPLANMAIAVQGGRNLSRRAAWFFDNEPGERSELAAAALVFMAEEASRAASGAVHVQGGLGVTDEAAATAYLVRARGWPLAAGDLAASAKHIGELIAARESAGDSVSAFTATPVTV